MKKNVTIPELAKLTGVSIGTVDRALNNRSEINPETKKKILAAAAKYNYRPNRLSKALVHNRTIRIGMITLPAKSPFIKKLTAAAVAAADEKIDFGLSLSVHPLSTFDAQEEASKIKTLVDSGIDALAIAGVDSPVTKKAIAYAIKKNAKVVTFNSDVSDTERLCFVGQNLHQSGQVAGDLLCKYMGEQGEVFVLHGSKQISAHRERLKGFCSVVDSDFPDIKIVAIEEDLDDDKIAYEKTKQILASRPNISGIYVVAAGNKGAGKALKESGRSSSVKMVCNDFVPMTEEFLEEGIIDATILQDPETQGRLPIDILFNLLFDKIQPEKDYYPTTIDIITKYNYHGHKGCQ